MIACGYLVSEFVKLSCRPPLSLSCLVCSPFSSILPQDIIRKPFLSGVAKTPLLFNACCLGASAFFTSYNIKKKTYQVICVGLGQGEWVFQPLTSSLEGMKRLELKSCIEKQRGGNREESPLESCEADCVCHLILNCHPMQVGGTSA